VEKIPMMALVAISVVILLFSYSKIDTSVGKSVSPAWGHRISNGLVSYAVYIEKMFVPMDLAVPYPHRNIPWEKTGIALAVLLGISYFAIKTVRSRPYIAVGWFWYLGTLVPVLGLVEFGSFSMADRFTYIPLIGLFIIVAWGVSDFTSKWACRRWFLGASGGIVLLFLMALSWIQTGYWKNSITLFEHAINVTSENYVAHNNLGIALREQGRVDEAIEHYSEALRIKPDHARAHNNLGVALKMKGAIDGAIAHFEAALRILPDYEAAHNNLGAALKKQGRLNEAIGHYHEAIRINPDYDKAYNNLGIALIAKGDVDGAVEQFQRAIEINPDYDNARNNLKKVLARRAKGLF
jgi:Tfp pilus assembly protein PilF